MAQFGASLYRNFRVYQIFGANTNVGKTIFSTLLCRIARRLNQAENVWYLKPVSTGPFDDADKWSVALVPYCLTLQAINSVHRPAWSSQNIGAGTWIGSPAT